MRVFVFMCVYCMIYSYIYLPIYLSIYTSIYLLSYLLVTLNLSNICMWYVCVLVYVCVCVCVCRRCILRTFIPRRAGFRDLFFFRELPPRTCSISTLHVRIGLRRPLAKFGKRPLKTCFPCRSFVCVLKTTDYSANLRMCGNEMN